MHALRVILESTARGLEQASTDIQRDPESLFVQRNDANIRIARLDQANKHATRALRVAIIAYLGAL